MGDNAGFVASATGNYRITIDSDDSGGGGTFYVKNSTSTLLTINESGSVTITSGVTRNGTHQLECTDSGAADLCTFEQASATVASITAEGLGDFSAAGVKLPILTATPDGSRSGSRGDVVLWASGGTYRLCVNTTSGSGTSTAWSTFTFL